MRVEVPNLLPTITARQLRSEVWLAPTCKAEVLPANQDGGGRRQACSNASTTHGGDRRQHTVGHGHRQKKHWDQTDDTHTHPHIRAMRNSDCDTRTAHNKDTTCAYGEHDGVDQPRRKPNEQILRFATPILESNPRPTRAQLTNCDCTTAGNMYPSKGCMVQDTMVLRLARPPRTIRQTHKKTRSQCHFAQRNGTAASIMDANAPCAAPLFKDTIRRWRQAVCCAIALG